MPSKKKPTIKQLATRFKKRTTPLYGASRMASLGIKQDQREMNRAMKLMIETIGQPVIRTTSFREHLLYLLAILIFAFACMMAVADWRYIDNGQLVMPWKPFPWVVL